MLCKTLRVCDSKQQKDSFWQLVVAVYCIFCDEIIVHTTQYIIQCLGENGSVKRKFIQVPICSEYHFLNENNKLINFSPNKIFINL